MHRISNHLFGGPFSHEWIARISIWEKVRRQKQQTSTKGKNYLCICAHVCAYKDIKIFKRRLWSIFSYTYMLPISTNHSSFAPHTKLCNYTIIFGPIWLTLFLCLLSFISFHFTKKKKKKTKTKILFILKCIQDLKNVKMLVIIKALL